MNTMDEPTYIYVVLRARGPHEIHATQQRAEIAAKACAEVDREPATIAALPAKYAAIVSPDGTVEWGEP
jgi:hypothetical protein